LVLGVQEHRRKLFSVESREQRAEDLCGVPGLPDGPDFYV
jgi:hypothetical protein